MRVFALLTILLLGYLALLATASDAEDDIKCACARNYDPVCGSDTVTYPNPCEFLCAQKRFARKGRSLLMTNRGSC